MKNFKKILKNQRGMSLVEVMVAAAVSITVSMGILKINETGQKALTKISTDVELGIWKTGVLYNELGNANTCSLNLNRFDLNTSGTTPLGTNTANTIFRGNKSGYPDVTSLTTTPIVQQALKIAGDTWEITSASLTHFPPSATVLKGECEIVLTLERKRNASGVKNRIMRAPLDCTLTSHTAPIRIDRCNVSGKADEKWADGSQSGVNWIYYSGEVVVGPSSTIPTSMFSVDTNGANDYPSGSGNNIKQGIEIISSGANQNGALIFTREKSTGAEESIALYKDSPRCLSIGDLSSGSLVSSSRFCPVSTSLVGTTRAEVSSDSSNNNAILGASDGVIRNAGTSFSSILGGSGVRITGSESAGAGVEIDIQSSNSYAFGRYLMPRHNNSFMIGSGSAPNASFTTSVANQFVGAFSNGYKFYTTTSPGSVAEASVVEITSAGDLRAAGGDMTAQAFYTTSDKRLKKNIVKIDSPLEIVNQLNGVFFQWKSNDELEMGFIAQNVERVFPMLVKTDEEGMKSVKYANITAVLVESVKELKKENEQLKKKVNLLFDLYCTDHPEVKECLD